ncbi:hypothetical protein D9615_003806 [Tricholomella constricta]|uniref:Cytochrome P450 n=1 Tax=Tricholomella constricta TaxID=117010 RepID=A0A8H5HI26_9AGAR|nr:hypothetical protein D9615_003806 [Tricholomella constricta]
MVVVRRIDDGNQRPGYSNYFSALIKPTLVLNVNCAVEHDGQWRDISRPSRQFAGVDHLAFVEIRRRRRFGPQELWTLAGYWTPLLMSRTTPGLNFLRRNLQVPVFVVCFIVVLGRWLELHLSIWVLASLPPVMIALHLIVRIVIREYAQAVDAALMGALPMRKGTRGGLSRVLFGHFGHSDGRLWRLVEDYGPVILCSNTIMTTSLEHMKIILSTDPSNYIRDESLHEAMGLVLGKGVFSSPDDMWKFHRTITRPFFNRNRATHLHLFTRHAQTVVSQISSCMKGGKSVDFQNLVRHSTLNIATDLLFGTCVSCLPYPTEANPNAALPFVTVTEFSEALLRVQEIVSERERIGWIWPLYELYRDKAKEPLRVIGRNLDPIIQWALGRKMMRTAGVTYHATHRGEEEETLLDHLIELTTEPRLVQSAILNTLIAGRAGTATTLTYIIYFLAQHPETTRRLRNEILENIGLTQIPDDKDMSRLKYLRAVINETLRLAPQTQYITRETVAATAWPSPNPDGKRIYIPAHAKILFDLSILHTSKDLWGPDADMFDPDRFLDHRYEKYLAPTPYIFVPFSSGPRTCLGKDFPYDEISITVIEILRHFTKITLPSTEQHQMSAARPLSSGVIQGLLVEMESTAVAV